MKNGVLQDTATPLNIYLLFLLSVEYVLIQPVKGFLHTAQGQRQVQTDVGLTMEGPAILPDHAHVPAGFHQLVHGLSVVFQPLGAVDEQHP